VSQSLHITAQTSREEMYVELTPQLMALFQGESNLIANAANFAALVSTVFKFHWVGFYWVIDTDLVLGPFQGPIACTRIAKGKGVCGTAWLNNETIVVPDVDAFPGHIACSPLSKSEIVVPVRNRAREVIGVLDIDSSNADDFSKVDRAALELWVRIFEEACHV